MAAQRGGKQFIPRPTSYRLGGAPPWADLAPVQRRFTLAEIRERLRAFPPPLDAVEYVSGTRAAAVLAALYESDGDTNVVFIKRPDTMPSHRGEIAFPGGKFEAGVDTDLRTTALREAHEEVGLAPEAVEVVGRLDGVGTVASQFTITPFVGFLGGRPQLVPNPGEVVRVLEVPMATLLDPGRYREERWDTWTDDLAVHFYELDDETIWGATARILTGFLARLVHAR